MLSGRGGIVVQGCLLILMGSFSLEPCLLTNPHFRTEHRVSGGNDLSAALELQTGNLQMVLEMEGLA